MIGVDMIDQTSKEEEIIDMKTLRKIFSLTKSQGKIILIVVLSKNKVKSKGLT